LCRRRTFARARALYPSRTKDEGRLVAVPPRRVPLATRRLAGLARRDVLVDAEDVLRIDLPLQRLQPVVLLGAVGLAHAVLALVHEEVDVHGGEVRLERRPEAPHPLALLVEALRRRRRAADVVREARVPPVEGGLVLAHARD